MGRWPIFRFVAESLRPVLGLSARYAARPDFDWQQVAAAASHHLVTPALGWCWHGRGIVPAEAEDYFAAALELNRIRNQSLLKGLEAALRALNGVEIVPVLLKGAAVLWTRGYPDDGIRILGDLDLLIPEESLAAAEVAISANGFEAQTQILELGSKHHHLPMRVHRETGAGIELHRSILPYRFASLIDTAACLRRATPLAMGDLKAAVLLPEDRIAHIICGQLIDGHHVRGIPQLRQMLDLAQLSLSNSEALKKMELPHRGRIAAALATATVARCNVLFNAPDADVRDVSRASRRMEEAIERSDRDNALASMKARVIDAPGFVRERPARLLRLLFPSVWRRFFSPSIRTW